MSRKPIILSASGGVERERTITDYERQDNDYYIEPYWVVDKLMTVIGFLGAVHDPCCGCGTIPRRLQHFRYRVSGADIIDRGYGSRIDFFEDKNHYDNMVFNPPFKFAEKFILHALTLTKMRVAVIVNLKFLASQGRRDRLFNKYSPEFVLICSQRPSMPPGGTGIEARGGTADYCWIIWNTDHGGNTIIKWLK